MTPKQKINKTLKEMLKENLVEDKKISGNNEGCMLGYQQLVAVK